MLKIYNTLTRQKEEFKPLEGSTVRIYSCGPTVYNYAHIGNLRTYIFMDLLRKVLKYNGYNLCHVMNITDVGHLVSDSDEGEDKMMKTAAEQKKTPWEIAAYYTDVFFKDIKKLNIEMPELTPKATDHIPEMIDFVVGLCDKGYGYETSDGIYFDIEKFPDYGKLSRLDLEGQQAGARIDVNTEKHHPADFAIWKKAPKEHIMQWESPWGMGYPGWHIECSAMALRYLGPLLDVHGGGRDLRFSHHESERAQSESMNGESPFAAAWMHTGMVRYQGRKMSKSLGNLVVVKQLLERMSPAAARLVLLSHHYRRDWEFRWDRLQQPVAIVAALASLVGTGPLRGAERPAGALADEFAAALDADLDARGAIRVLRAAIRARDVAAARWMGSILLGDAALV